MHHVVLIEDQDRSSLQAVLEQAGKGDLSVTAVPPPSDFDLTAILQTPADLFLVDYELDTVQEDDTIANYRGTTLAAHIREAKPEFPIVLLTRSDLPIWESQKRTIEAIRVYDDILFKTEDISLRLEETYDELVALADGYFTLREQRDRSLLGLLDLLKTDDEGSILAIDAMPPQDNWQAIEASYWIRKVLLNFPGVLYDSIHAAVSVGMSEQSFRQSSVQSLFRDATYQGPFAGRTQYWWKHSLLNIVNNLVSHDGNAFGMRQQFLIDASRITSVQLEPSKDAQSGTDYADTVCYLMGTPIRIETSLPYKPDNRPIVMDEARVSFRAIRETNDVDENYLDAASRMMLDEIRQNTI